MTEQSLAKPSPKKELRQWLESEDFKRQLRSALPENMSPGRFVRIVLTSTMKNPALLSCTQESFFYCLMQLAAMGIEPDGRCAYLIPFKDVCTLIVGYRGISEVLRRNHDVAAIHCDVVGVNDQFVVRYGSRGILDHVPNIRERGEIWCAYSWVKLPDGSEEFDVMGVEEIEAIRKRSRTPDKGPWVTDWNEMAKKTIFRRHSKLLPLSPKTREVLERETDGDALSDTERFQHAQAAKVVEPRFEETPQQQPSAPRRGRPSKPQAPQQETLSGLETAQPASSAQTARRLSTPESAGSPLEQVIAKLAQANIPQEKFVELLYRNEWVAAPDVEEIRAGNVGIEQCNPDGLDEALKAWPTVLEELGKL